MTVKRSGLDTGEDITLDRLDEVLKDSGKAKKDPMVEAIANAIKKNTFEGHAGRPGQVGGSLPKGAGVGDVSAKKKADIEKSKNLKGLVQQLHNNGGFSQTIEGVSPSTGYMVSIHDGFKTPTEDVTDDKIVDFAVEQVSLLGQKDTYLGGWLDKDESGKEFAFIDISRNIQSLDDTVKLGVETKQIGIYDIKN